MPESQRMSKEDLARMGVVLDILRERPKTVTLGVEYLPVSEAISRMNAELAAKDAEIASLKEKLAEYERRAGEQPSHPEWEVENHE